jgi:hypothetical protein
MPKYAFALLAVTFALLPVSLRACGDCGCDDLPVVVHFKDGLTPNGPVTGDPGYAVTVEGNSSGCGCNSAFGFRDYGPARVVPPPAPVDTKEMKRPSS